MRALSFKRLLGSTRLECSLQEPPEERELTRRVGWSFRCTRIDRPPFKLIAHMAWEEMHMEVRSRIAMDLVIHLDGLDDLRHGHRNLPQVTHERCSLGLGQVMQLDCVAPEDQTHVAGHRVVRANQNPRGLEVGNGVGLAAADPTVGPRSLSVPCREISPTAHGAREGLNVLPNGSRLSCGALKKDSFHNLRAPPASSAC